MNVINSPVIELLDEKNPILLRNEVEKLHKELKERSLDCATMHNKLKELDERYRNEKADKITKEKAYHIKITQLSNQLVGAIRKINYLINEKNRKIRSDNSDANYIASLEMKYNESKRQIMTLPVSRLLKSNKSFQYSEKENIKAFKERNIESIKNIDKEISRVQEELFTESNKSSQSLIE